jgi:hypothetical protein
MRLAYTYRLSAVLIAMFTMPVVADDPKELEGLRDSWTRARTQATNPIDKKYADALSSMKVKFTKEGNLEAALAVDAELKKLTETSVGSVTTSAQPNATVPRKQREGIEKSLLAKWNMPNGAYGQFQGGNIWSLEGVKSKYTVEKSGEIIITNDAKQSARLQLSEDQNTLKGTWFDGSPIEIVRRPL